MLTEMTFSERAPSGAAARGVGARGMDSMVTTAGTFSFFSLAAA